MAPRISPMQSAVPEVAENSVEHAQVADQGQRGLLEAVLLAAELCPPRLQPAWQARVWLRAVARAGPRSPPRASRCQAEADALCLLVDSIMPSLAGMKPLSLQLVSSQLVVRRPGRAMIM